MTAILWFALAFGPGTGAPSAEEIMAQVAQKQEASDQARLRYVYRQKLNLKLIKSNRKLAREEDYEYTVVPAERKVEKKLEQFRGKYERDGKLIEYDHPHYEYKDLDIDGDLISDLAEDLANDEKTRDGIDKGVFPLSADEQRKYRFELLGEREIRGRKAHRIGFTPKSKEEFGWKGEALIDMEDMHPIMISTDMSKKVPMAVQLLLGTNLKQVGFQVSYQRVAPGVWFPSSYGTEFYVKVLFMYKRTITLSMANSDFQQVSSDSTIRFEEPADQAPLIK